MPRQIHLDPQHCLKFKRQNAINLALRKFSVLILKESFRNEKDEKNTVFIALSYGIHWNCSKIKEWFNSFYWFSITLEFLFVCMIGSEVLLETKYLLVDIYWILRSWTTYLRSQSKTALGFLKECVFIAVPFIAFICVGWDKKAWGLKCHTSFVITQIWKQPRFPNGRWLRNGILPSCEKWLSHLQLV